MHPLQNHSQRDPSIPQEILDLIIQQIPLKNYILASLALCNKSFYSTYNVLLYRDIHLSTPAQLIQLYDSERSKSKLSLAHALHIDEAILHDETWEDVRSTFDPVHYLITILRATTSLRWFHVIQSRFGVTNPYPPKPLSSICVELDKQLEPLMNEQRESFLPNLHILSDIGVQKPFNLLFGRRPLMLWSTSRESELEVYVSRSCVNVDLFGNDVSDSAYEEARSKVPSSRTRTLSAADVGYFVRDLMLAESAPGLPITTTSLRVWISTADTMKLPPSVGTPIPWIQSMLAALAEPQLKCLHVYFHETFPDIPLNKQPEALLELEKFAPALVDASIASPYVRWQKGTGQMVISSDVEYVISDMDDRSSMYTCLPDWTPLPNDDCPDVLPWWISALRLELPGSRGRKARRKLRRLARELQVGMLMRWPECYSPDDNESEYVFSRDQIYHALLELV